MNDSCVVCGSSDLQEVVLNGLPLLRCSGCGLLWQAEPSLGKSYYEELDAGDTPEKREARFRNSRDRIRLFTRFVPRAGWCDVGTGEGIFLEALAAARGQGVGIEPSEGSREKAATHGVRIVGDTIADLGRVVQEAPATRVVSLFHVIEHLKDPDVEIRRIYDVLPPGGFLVIETPDIDSPVFKLRKYKDPLIYPEHLWYFSDKTLRVLLERTGFRVVASGVRDFDQYHLPIRESLFRLGLLSAKQTEDGSAGEGMPGGPKAIPSAVRDGLVRRAIRFILSRIVIMTGRLQYVWVVAQK